MKIKERIKINQQIPVSCGENVKGEVRGEREVKENMV